MKDFLKRIPLNLVILVVLFVAGCLMLSTVNEATYEELMSPIPFIGMILIIVSIVWVFIGELIRK